LALASCYPGDLLNVQDADIAVTAYDASFDFSTAQTWAMPDTVVAIDTDESRNLYDHELDDAILAQIEENMTALGYTREMDVANNGADLIVLAQVNVSNNYSAYTYYPYDPYWGFYPGWSYWGGYPGYGGYYPWYGGYPPTTVVSNTQTGSVIIEIIDPNVEGPSDDGPTLTVRWGAVLNGLTGAGEEGRVSRAIDQAFDQSPYLGS
jgi:hypothetical protein